MVTHGETIVAQRAKLGSKTFRMRHKVQREKWRQGMKLTATRLVQCGPDHTGDGNGSQVLLHAVHVKTVTNSSSKQQLIKDDQLI